ncbi:hypothetical protein [Streptomyces sp. NPDC048577]|uniref:SCO7613 C-terminal domain-containing membrane protein n=1 Tax=Streptomyces sp. NPDC048577 TaxID=3157209 RepID=UPI00342D1563
MENSLPPADELVLVDRELARLDARRSQLLARRAWLLRFLAAPAAGPSAPPATWRPAGPARPRADVTPRGAQNLLLTLGGALLTIAAIAFTLVSWGSMGIGGRAAVLCAVTSAALLAPPVLLRRGLVSTAESLAALGLALMALDAYALRRAALPDTDALGYAAVATAVLAGAWAAYGSALGRLRGPLPVAVVAAQLPLPLAVLAAHGGPLPLAWAALATAVADLALARWAKPAAVRVTAGGLGGALGGWALLTGGLLSLSSAVPAGALLLAGAAAALYVAWRMVPVAEAAAVVAGLAVVAAAGGVLRAVVPADWVVPVYVLCAPVVAVAWRSAAPRAVRRGLAGAGAAVLALGLLWALPPVVAGLVGPAARTTVVWSGPRAERLLAWYPATAPLVLLLGAVALALVPRLWARCGALFLVWALATALPVSLGLPYGVTSTLQLLTTAAALLVAVRPESATRALGTPVPVGPAGGEGPAGRPQAAGTPVSPETVLARSGLACGLASALSCVAVALDTRGGTFVALGLLLGLFTAAGFLAEGARRSVAACAAVAAATGLVVAGACAAGLPAHLTAVALLAVPAVTAAVGARLRRHPVAAPVELTGAAVGLLSVGLASTRPAVLALVLALAGVLAAATAVRPERRPVASWTAAALFLLATWVRLALWDVTAPEAYTVPVTVPALVVGTLRRRRDPRASSWTAYGPGLAATLVPGVVAVWADPAWPRPLLLGLAALAVTLLGARFRLQAPLLLGGAVVLLVGTHELAPYVLRAVEALPRWLPPALAGLLLLGVGATYEQRLRDARRLREGLGRLR